MQPHRAVKVLGAAKVRFGLNPEYGYLNSQVPDSVAFLHYQNALAGTQTQLELQGVVPDPTGPAPFIKAEFDSADKENWRSITATEQSKSRGKRVVDSEQATISAERPTTRIKTEHHTTPFVGSPCSCVSDFQRLQDRISFLEAELAGVRIEFSTAINLATASLRSSVTSVREFQTRMIQTQIHPLSRGLHEMEEMTARHERELNAFLHGEGSKQQSFDDEPDLEDGSQPEEWLTEVWPEEEGANAQR
ncbi:hypothetical protein C8J57DRAFT_1545045 [Mycena rebaudengoi]|nr:hypothetical protein C8J57DRAFT_1548213 [Mycena rebaudengoi]KAJ7199526.1 hypothetical protein C8J57DRAFT_1545045 [Mycena rebaudengoi]